MDQETFSLFRNLVYERSGILLRNGKELMVAARIAKRMRTLGMGTPQAYLRYVRRDSSGHEITCLIDAISTNVTRFFRNQRQFDRLRETVQKWVEGGQRKFRFWSAGCSTGEEPYSIAMTVLDAAPVAVLDLKILATDISTRALAVARAGVYELDDMAGISPLFRQQYFENVEGQGEVQWIVRAPVREVVLFKPFNLSRFPYPMRGPMDVIFCCNVMIYFNKETCQRILAEFSRLLRPGGFLMTGHAEGLTCAMSGFKTINPSVYIKAGGPDA